MPRPFRLCVPHHFGGHVCHTALMDYVCRTALMDYVCRTALMDYVCRTALMDYVCRTSLGHMSHHYLPKDHM